jgi:hypothetical protein
VIRRALVWMLIAGVMMAGLADLAESRISLGSAQGLKSLALEQGGSGSASIYLFNMHQEEDLEIYLGVIEDGGLMVEVEPEVMVIPYSRPGEVEGECPVIGTSRGDVLAREASVRFSVPFNAQEGDHEVVVYAATQRQGGAVGSAQVRKFYFNVKVEGAIPGGLAEQVETEAGEEEALEVPQEPEEEEPQQSEEGDVSEEEIGDSITGLVTRLPVFGPYLLAGIIVLLVLLRMVKRI